MIKVITLSCHSWNYHYENPEKDQDPKLRTANDLMWYESPILENYINNGWAIQDWKMSNSRNCCYWTFILYKSDANKDL